MPTVLDINPFKLAPGPDIQKLDSSSIIEYEKIFFQSSQSEENIRRHPFALEEYYAFIVRNGDIKRANELVKIEQKHTDKTTFRLSKTIDQHVEYCSIIRVYICSQAAIYGGVVPLEAKDLSDLYMRKISLCHSKDQYNKITQACFLVFTKMVYENKPDSLQFTHVKKCKNYIGHHLSEKITLSDLAAYVGINPNYLSTIFKQCQGVTITQYIIDLRVSFAKRELAYSDKNVTQIASDLSFGSPSRCASIFKKSTGMTPLEYRKKYNHLGVKFEPKKSL